MLQSLAHPARVVPLAFLFAIFIGTLLLLTPWATAADGTAPLLVALFTSVSAVCVTGLIVVDTATYWSGFGQLVIMLLFQFGGFGFMTAATLLGVIVSRRLGLSGRLIAQAENRTLSLGDIGEVVRLIFAVTVVTEAAVALALIARFAALDGIGLGQAIWSGVFHSISAFNNAGFSVFSDGLIGFSSDWLVLGAVMLGVVIGGIGFPVIADLKKHRFHRWRWSVHTKLTIIGYAGLFLIGSVGTAIIEWDNAEIFGAMSGAERVLNSVFHSVVARTAGFNSVDVGQMRSETLALTYLLMFVGGGSAGTAGGIKVTTAMVLVVAVVAEVRGERDTNAMGRRIPTPAIRQALTVVVLGILAVVLGSYVLLADSNHRLEVVLFEAVSAFSTVGLSTGITATLPPSGQVVLIGLMYLGRVGTITIATALALKRTPALHRYPEERPIIG